MVHEAWVGGRCRELSALDYLLLTEDNLASETFESCIAAAGRGADGIGRLDPEARSAQLGRLVSMLVCDIPEGEAASDANRASELIFRGARASPEEEARWARTRVCTPTGWRLLPDSNPWAERYATLAHLHFVRSMRRTEPGCALEALRFGIERGGLDASLGAGDGEWTPLHRAISARLITEIAWLLEQGASLDLAAHTWVQADPGEIQPARIREHCEVLGEPRDGRIVLAVRPRAYALMLGEDQAAAVIDAHVGRTMLRSRMRPQGAAPVQ